ncbi:M20 family metallopeptidase [Amycolatopsis cynarae]|uniref:M20 family metallopeptidase n=1 Tax=Amycolatopsis cynarae TaxID=2995223 RepID=A0ABY7B3Q1_9PSEU|nr:M20 family metallopeptidase [Amycolatopsis sp. HUAS 11-8]WAL65857.1 M20 family metallopeptidase [Amycolatopsis sp. HUAS 11-8]
MPSLERLLRLVDLEIPAAIALRERLHAVPETGFSEFRTAELVAEAMPVECTRVAKTGLLARIGGPRGVLVRAELDGLAVPEETGAPFASANGCMHACGHDVHLAALVALTRAAHLLRDELPAPFVAVCQPSEERHPSGAVALLADSELAQGFDAVVAAHLHPLIAWGSVGVEPGAVNAAADAAEIVVTGEGGHGAYPHLATDPVLALAQTVVALHGLVGRRIDPTHAATLTVGRLEAGTAENVIPAQARAWATLRALDAADQAALRTAFVSTVEGVAAAHGCTATVRFTKSDPPLVNDETLARLAAELAPAAGLRVAPPWRSCGGDDFAHLNRLGPALMAFVGLRDAPGFRPRPLHHPEFLPPAESVRLVARAQALAYFAGARSAHGTERSF